MERNDRWQIQLLSSTSLTTQPCKPILLWAKASIHPSSCSLALCVFCLVCSDMLMGQLMDWQPDPARGAGGCRVYFIQTAKGKVSPLIAHLPPPLILTVSVSAPSHPFYLISAFVSFASISHGVFSGLISLSSFPLPCLGHFWNISPMIDWRLQGKLGKQIRWTLMQYWEKYPATKVRAAHTAPSARQ